VAKSNKKQTINQLILLSLFSFSVNILRLFFVFSFCLLTANGLFAAKIIEKDVDKSIVTLDESFKKGTRLEVFVGFKRIGLIESLGGFKAKIIYGKNKVDIGAIAQVKGRRDGTWRLTYAPLNFLDIGRNLEYESLTNEALAAPSSRGFRLRFKMDHLKSKGITVGAGFYFGYTRLGSYLSGFEIGPNVIVAMETIPEVLELHLTGGAGILWSLSEHKWARPEGQYDDEIGRNQGEADPSINTLPIEVGGGIDWRISSLTSIFVYGLYTRFLSGNWRDTQTKAIIRKEWLEYHAANLSGFTIEMGVRINVVYK